MRLSVQAGVPQCAQDFFDVLRPAGLQHKLEFGVLHRQSGKGALVFNLLDVRAGMTDECGSAGQFARHVAGVHADTREAPGPHHAALDDDGEHQGIDVSAG